MTTRTTIALGTLGVLGVTGLGVGLGVGLSPTSSSTSSSPDDSPSSATWTLSGQTLGQVCGLDINFESATLGLYPPSTAENPASYATDTAVSYEYEPGRGPQPFSIHPLVPGTDVPFPPFFGNCNGAKDSWLTLMAHCDGSHSVQMASTFCDMVDTYATLFSILLQLEFFASIDRLPQKDDFGTAYVSSLFDVPPQFPVLGVEYTRGLRHEFTNVASELTSLANANAMLTLDDKGLIDFMVGLGQGSFASHLNTLRGLAIRTSSTATDPLAMPMIRHRNGNTYPEHSDSCIVTRQLFDFLLQNPRDRYPVLSDNLDRTFRCSAVGARLMQIETDILKIEKDVVSVDPALCPSTAQPITDLLDEFSHKIIVSSEVYRTIATPIAGETAAYLAIAAPQAAATYWLPGVDVEILRALFIRFIETHIPPIERACGLSIPFKDPSGQMILTTTVDGSLFATYAPFVNFWLNDYAQLFPESTTYRAFQPNSADAVLRGWKTGSNVTKLNNAFVFPRETEESLTAYSYQRRFEEWQTVFPSASHFPIPDNFHDCAFDPTGLMGKIINAPAEANYGLTLSMVVIFSTVDPAMIALDCANATKTFTPECIVAYCDIKSELANNPDSFYFIQGSYNHIPSTFGDYAAPLCADAGHAKSVEYCEGVDLAPLLTN